MKYTIITVNRDIYMDEYGNDKISLPYVYVGEMKLFNSKEDAFDTALKSIEDELKDTGDCDLSFNIPEDDDYQEGRSVKIYGYADDQTYIVTEKIIAELAE